MSTVANIAAERVEYASGPEANDHHPAMRRLRLVALLSAGATLLAGAAGLVNLPLELRRFGGADFLWQQPASFWASLLLPILASLLLAAAALGWRIGMLRRSKWVATAALAAAAVMFVDACVGVARWLDFRGVVFLLQTHQDVVIRGFLGFGMTGVLPLTLAWAAWHPGKFSEPRLLGLAALVSLFYSSLVASSVARLWSQGTWPPSTHYDVTILAQAASGFAAAILFALGIRAVRGGRTPASAVVASWMLLILIIWTCGFAYGILHPDWVNRRSLGRLLMTTSLAGGMVGSLAATMAFLMPLRARN